MYDSYQTLRLWKCTKTRKLTHSYLVLMVGKEYSTADAERLSKHRWQYTWLWSVALLIKPHSSKLTRSYIVCLVIYAVISTGEVRKYVTFWWDGARMTVKLRQSWQLWVWRVRWTSDDCGPVLITEELGHEFSFTRGTPQYCFGRDKNLPSLLFL